MKYCVPYSKNFKYLKEIDEIKFSYGGEYNKDLFYHLLEKKEDFIDKRIIISVVYNTKLNDFFVDNLIELKVKGFNITVLFPSFDDEEQWSKIILQLKENQIAFFYNVYASDWDTFIGLINLGVSDIYVVENLGFELNLLGRLATEAEVSIRVFANVCQTSWKKGNSIKSFFIRPEDVILYEPYVSVIEFYGQESNIQNVMFRVYAKEKKWFGNLREVIIGLDKDVDSRFLLPIFAVRRISCGKKCVKGGKCNICDRILESEKVLKDKELYIR